MFFEKLYGESFLRVSKFAKSIKRCSVGQNLFVINDYGGGNHLSSFVMARCLGNDINFSSLAIRPAIVRKILEIDVFTKSCNKEICFNYFVAECQWFKQHQFQDYYGVNCPTKVWSTDFEEKNVLSFIPLKFIESKFVCCKELITFKDSACRYPLADNVNIVIPLPSKSIL